MARRRDSWVNHACEKLLADAAANARYLIWSHSHRAWWRPERSGYTSEIDQAGRYSREEADQICPGHPRCGDPDDGGPWETMHLAPEHGGRSSYP